MSSKAHRQVIPTSLPHDPFSLCTIYSTWVQIVLGRNRNQELCPAWVTPTALLGRCNCAGKWALQVCVCVCVCVVCVCVCVCVCVSSLCRGHSNTWTFPSCDSFFFRWFPFVYFYDFPHKHSRPLSRREVTGCKQQFCRQPEMPSLSCFTS